MRQRRHHLLIFLLTGIGFAMDQETSDTTPACLSVFHMKFDNIVLCSYFWLLKYYLE